MQKKPRKKIFLILTVLSLLSLFSFIYFFSPTSKIPLGLFSLPPLIFVFLSMFILLYSLTAFIFKSFIHGILIGLFPIVYLSMRLQDLTSPLFFVLLAGIFVALEILLVQLTSKPKIRSMNPD